MESDRQTGRRHSLYVIRELTKREIKRKYARSYLGIAWSILSPLLNMAVVTFIFSYVFSRNIENYPAYYFTGHIITAFFSTATTHAMTALKDNRGMMLTTKIPKEAFVISRVYTALVNLGFSCIAFVAVLIFFRITPTPMIVLFPVDVFFLTLFALGVSYALSVWFVHFEDTRNIFGIVIMILTRFSALFYSADVLTPTVRRLVSFNPLYTYVKVARDSILYGKLSEPQFMIQMAAWGVGMFIVGRLIFKLSKNRIMEKL